MQIWVRFIKTFYTVEIEPEFTLKELIACLDEKIRGKVPWEDVWFDCAGRPLTFGKTLIGHYNLQKESIIHASGRLYGGGGDGGSTGAESRDAYLEMYRTKKADKVDPVEERIARWTRCQLTGEPLMPPCVCDELGSLFNKESVVKALLEKTMPASLSHISSLKHIIPLKLERNPNAGKSEGIADARNYQNYKAAAFHCPISGLEFNGSFRFMAHRATGNVFSERALKDGRQAVEDILDGNWKPDDWILINGSEAEMMELREKMLERRANGKGKNKKRKKPDGKDNGNKSKVKAKKLQATEFTPAMASKDVYASIFNSSHGEEQETYLCRSTAARGMNLT